MSQALQRFERGDIAVQSDPMADWQLMCDQGAKLLKTGFLPSSIKTAEQAVAIIMTGRELGIGVMVSLNNINVIQGKPTVPPQLMLALINRTKELEQFDITDDGQACTVTMKRRNRKPHSETFSMKDASLLKTTEGYGDAKKTISLSEKYNWKQQPGTMRKWRAVAACARVVFPDVILGLYTPDEMGAATASDGERDWMDASPPEPTEGFQLPPLSNEQTASGYVEQAVDEREEVIEALHQLYLDGGKSEEDWLAYWKEQPADLPLDKLKSKRDAWQDAITQRAQALMAIEQEIANLDKAGITKIEQDKLIAKTAKGKSLDECDTKLLRAINEVLLSANREVAEGAAA